MRNRTTITDGVCRSDKCQGGTTLRILFHTNSLRQTCRAAVPFTTAMARLYSCIFSQLLLELIYIFANGRDPAGIETFFYISPLVSLRNLARAKATAQGRRPTEWLQQPGLQKGWVESLCSQVVYIRLVRGEIDGSLTRPPFLSSHARNPSRPSYWGCHPSSFPRFGHWKPTAAPLRFFQVAGVAHR